MTDTMASARVDPVAPDDRSNLLKESRSTSSTAPTTQIKIATSNEDMTEDEVNQMVQDALLRARRAIQSRGGAGQATPPTGGVEKKPLTTAISLDDESCSSSEWSQDLLSDEEEGEGEDEGMMDTTKDHMESILNVSKGPYMAMGDLDYDDNFQEECVPEESDDEGDDSDEDDHLMDIINEFSGEMADLDGDEFPQDKSVDIRAFTNGASETGNDGVNHRRPSKGPSALEKSLDINANGRVNDNKEDSDEEDSRVNDIMKNSFDLDGSSVADDDILQEQPLELPPPPSMSLADSQQEEADDTLDRERVGSLKNKIHPSLTESSSCTDAAQMGTMSGSNDENEYIGDILSISHEISMSSLQEESKCVMGAPISLNVRASTNAYAKPKEERFAEAPFHSLLPSQNVGNETGGNDFPVEDPWAPRVVAEEAIPSVDVITALEADAVLGDDSSDIFLKETDPTEGEDASFYSDGDSEYTEETVSDEEDDLEGDLSMLNLSDDILQVTLDGDSAVQFINMPGAEELLDEFEDDSGAIVKADEPVIEGVENGGNRNVNSDQTNMPAKEELLDEYTVNTSNVTSKIDTPTSCLMTVLESEKPSEDSNGLIDRVKRQAASKNISEDPFSMDISGWADMSADTAKAPSFDESEVWWRPKDEEKESSEDTFIEGAWWDENKPTEKKEEFVEELVDETGDMFSAEAETPKMSTNKKSPQHWWDDIDVASENDEMVPKENNLTTSCNATAKNDRAETNIELEEDRKALITNIDTTELDDPSQIRPTERTHNSQMNKSSPRGNILHNDQPLSPPIAKPSTPSGQQLVSHTEKSTSLSHDSFTDFKVDALIKIPQHNSYGQTAPSKKQRAIEFRNPYPLPPPAPRLRPPATLVAETFRPAPNIPIKWTRPSPQLAELLIAATGSSVARRSNACGALKVLAARKENRIKLARTIGLLDALVFAGNQSPPSSLADGAFDARTRAVTTLLYFSTPMENRMLVFNRKGVPECLVKVMREDWGEGRVNACSALAYLAKTPENRSEMVKIPELLNVLAMIILGKVKEQDPAEDATERAFFAKKEGIGNATISADNQSQVTDHTHKSLDTLENIRDDYSSYPDDASEYTSSTFHRMNSNITDNDLSEESSTVKTDSTLDKNSKQGMKEGKSTQLKGMKPNQNAIIHTAMTPVIHEDGNKVPLIIHDARKVHVVKREEYLATARLNSCAVLSHLVKYCPVSNPMSKHDIMVDTLIEVSLEFGSPVHTRCIEILCHLTRFPINNSRMARKKSLVETMIKCGRSKLTEDRVWALRTLQNLAADGSSKIVLASTPLLTMLSISAMRKDEEEKLAAVAALFNLSTEPGTIVPLTNTKNVVATLVHLAHNPGSSYEVRRMACDALATIGLWLQTLAGAGTVPEGVDIVPLPSHNASGWQRWD